MSSKRLHRRAAISGAMCALAIPKCLMTQAKVTTSNAFHVSNFRPSPSDRLRIQGTPAENGTITPVHNAQRMETSHAQPPRMQKEKKEKIKSKMSRLWNEVTLIIVPCKARKLEGSTLRSNNRGQKL